MDHGALVEEVRKQVLARPEGKRLTIRKSRGGHTPHDYTYKAGRHPVDVSKLDQILDIDQAGRTATVQAQVTMGQLCQATLPLGLLPAVVPEFETFTTAGLINGLGIETSSPRYGIFPETVLGFQLVLGNGDVVEVDREQHRDLFYTVPGSYGTLGVVTRATIRLVPAKPFVRSRYRHFEELSEYVAAFSRALDEHDFVEGFVYSPGSHVVITGDFSDEVEGLGTYHAMKFGNLWYDEHAKKMARKHREDLVPSYEYLFRHQRSFMWMSRLGNFLHLPMTRLGRWMLDKLIDRYVKEQGLTSYLPHGVRERSVVTQDVAVRLGRLQEGIEYVENNIGVYPLWNCAARGFGDEMLFIVNQKHTPEQRQRILREDRFAVDIGIYGEPTVRGYDPRETLRELQKFVDMPAMWGVSYLTPEEFAEVWDLETYRAVQRRYHATEAFGTLEDKVRYRDDGEKRTGRHFGWRIAAIWHHLKGRYLTSRLPIPSEGVSERSAPPERVAPPSAAAHRLPAGGSSGTRG